MGKLMVSYAEYRAALERVPEYRRIDVEILEAQAVSYVWGRQDAGESVRDTGWSTDFGHAYGLHAARFAASEICYRMNIERAFLRWREGKPIED